MLTAAQICTLSAQDARVPGFTSQAGQALNMILLELCQTYDFNAARKLFQFTFNSATGNQSGPYTFPADYLRAKKGECWYTILGVPYKLTSVDLDEYDMLVQTAGNNGYPQVFATDMSQGPVQGYFWPPPSGSYNVSIRYQAQMPDIATPETSATVPWFPQQTYLRRRLAGELMIAADDERAEKFLTDDAKINPQGAGVILEKFLKLHDDDEGRVKRVTLDPRRFKPSSAALKNTKLIGW